MKISAAVRAAFLIVTAAVLAGTFTTPTLAPGQTYAIRVRIEISAGAAHGSSVMRTFTQRSVVDNSKIDVVAVSLGRR